MQEIKNQIRHEIDGYTITIDGHIYDHEDLYSQMGNDQLFKFTLVNRNLDNDSPSLIEEYSADAYDMDEGVTFPEWARDNGVDIVRCWAVYTLMDTKFELSNKPFSGNRESAFIGHMYVTSQSILRAQGWKVLDGARCNILDQLAADFFKKHNPNGQKVWRYTIFDSKGERVWACNGFIDDKEGALSDAKTRVFYLEKARRESLKQSRKISLTQKLAAYLTGFFAGAKS